MTGTRSLFAVLLLPVVSFAAEPVHLTGREAEAIHLATKVFKSKQGNKNQKVIEFTGTLSIMTLRSSATPKVRSRLRPEVGADREAASGGSTDYGWEVHYIIALDQMKILEEHYAR